MYAVLRCRDTAGGPNGLRRLGGPCVHAIAAFVRTPPVANLYRRQPHHAGRCGGVFDGVVLKAGEQRIARQSARTEVLILLCEPCLQRGDHSRLARAGRALNQGDVRRVQDDVQRVPLPLVGIVEHLAYGTGHRLESARPPITTGLVLKDKAELWHRVVHVPDPLPRFPAPLDSHLVSAQGDEEIAFIGRLTGLLVYRRPDT